LTDREVKALTSSYLHNERKKNIRDNRYDVLFSPSRGGAAGGGVSLGNVPLSYGNPHC
jgi:hypothetical protein